MWMRMQVSGRQSKDPSGAPPSSPSPPYPHPFSDLTSSRRPSLLLLSGSAPEAGCWAIALSESGSTSVTAAALGSDTSLQQGQEEEDRWDEKGEERERLHDFYCFVFKFNTWKLLVLEGTDNDRHYAQLPWWQGLAAPDMYAAKNKIPHNIWAGVPAALTSRWMEKTNQNR